MKRREALYWLVIAALVGALVAPLVSAQVGGEWTITEQSDSRIVLERAGSPEPTATATTEPAPTATSTPVPPTPTQTPVPTATSTEEPDPATGAWHPPIDHEHGDEPPQWATDWSLAAFGHGIVYGGDEQTPGEWVNKPRAFKGATFTSDAGGDGYLRYHGQANAVGRSSQFHSSEIYYRDTAGNVSFWQGWVDAGDPATARVSRCQEDPGDRPVMLVVDACAWDAFIRFEQWYMTAVSDWHWDIGVAIGNATTLWEPDERFDLPDIGPPTGSLGLTRRVDGFWYLGRGGGGTDLTGWFCADVLGVVVSEGDPTCATGGIPQYIAPTIAQDAQDDGFGNFRVEFLIQRSYACPACALPN